MEPDRFRKHLANLMMLAGATGYVSVILSTFNLWGSLL